MNTETSGEAKFLKEAFKFESKMLNLNLAHCSICHQTRIALSTKNNICTRCKRNDRNMYGNENKALPTWIMGNEIMYHIPKELVNLTIAEKLLIQRVTPLIPVIHIKNGILGLRGHIVSFFQDITSIARILPRLPSEVSIIKVIKEGTSKEGDSVRTTFTVNRHRVLNALRWLKRFNPLYQDVTIDENQLQWMKGNNTEILQHIIEVNSNDNENEEKGDR